VEKAGDKGRENLITFRNDYDAYRDGRDEDYGSEEENLREQNGEVRDELKKKWIEKKREGGSEKPEEWVEKSPEGESEKPVHGEKISLEKMGIEKKWWNETIEKIKNPVVRDERIERAREIIQAEDELDEKLASGEISQSRYDHEKLVVLGKRKARFSVGADLDSVGLSWDRLGQVSEEQRILIEEAAGDPAFARFRDRVERAIQVQGPEWVKDWADDNLENGRMPKEVHESVTRKVRVAKTTPKKGGIL